MNTRQLVIGTAMASLLALSSAVVLGPTLARAESTSADAAEATRNYLVHVTGMT